MKQLPIGIQSFAKLRENDYLYVDKTREIHTMVNSGSVFFLSRPRRFGKSLLLSTLQALFSGRKDLFEGLYISDKYDWNRDYPVVTLDWSKIAHQDTGTMEKGLLIYEDQIAADYDIALKHTVASNRLAELLSALHAKTGKKAVVLIDEYDMPLLDSLSKSPALTNEIKEYLRSFYQILKASDEHLRFVFLTGISKFGKVSIFSGLNNINDITMDEKYSTLCGYTQTEVEFYFEPYITETLQANKTDRDSLLGDIQFWYNGFSWDGNKFLYNPFSILLFFEKKIISNYWFETGSPSFLVNLIKERNDIKYLLEPCKMHNTELHNFDPLELSTKVLMFQSGYLTIKSGEKSPFDPETFWNLAVPNEEVRRSMLQHLTSSFACYPVEESSTLRNTMMSHLVSGNCTQFEDDMKELFARIPYQLHIKREAYYHSLFLLWLNLLGFSVDAEIPTNQGRIDAVWDWQNRIIIAEIKYSETGNPETLLNEAMSQMRKRRYVDRYLGQHRSIKLLAIAFTGNEISCKMEEAA